MKLRESLHGAACIACAKNCAHKPRRADTLTGDKNRHTGKLPPVLCVERLKINNKNRFFIEKQK